MMRLRIVFLSLIAGIVLAGCDDDTERASIHRVNLNSGAQSALLIAEETAYYWGAAPSWSPDGAHIIFTSDVLFQ